MKRTVFPLDLRIRVKSDSGISSSFELHTLRLLQFLSGLELEPRFNIDLGFKVEVDVKNSNESSISGEPLEGDESKLKVGLEPNSGLEKWEKVGVKKDVNVSVVLLICGAVIYYKKYN